jgi:hypothetical protein
MMQATRVRPGKHPTGGYQYANVDTGRMVYPHDYERVYLAGENDQLAARPPPPIPFWGTYPPPPIFLVVRSHANPRTYITPRPWQ